MFVEIRPESLPLPIARVYTLRGHAIAKAEVKDVVCRWDGVRRGLYRITSGTGKLVEWIPSSRPLTAWLPKLLK